MRSFGRQVATFFLSAALFVAPTAAVAAPAGQGPAASSADAWTTLSMLATSGSPALAGTAAAVAQPADAPPPPRASYGIGPLPLPVIAVWLGVIALDIYLLSRDDHHHHVPNSPA